MKIIVFAFLLLIFIVAAARMQHQPLKDEQITVDGITRTFVTYLPANHTDNMPVVISLHGNLGTGKGQYRLADFRPLADKDGFIIVCPDGIDRSWNDGRATKAHEKGIDDVNFIDELITYVINTYHADANRVYVTGMSNGGFMASRLACQLYKRIAAVAIVAATMDKDVDYTPAHPMPIMYIHGTSDPFVPYNGGMMKRGAGGLIYGHEEALQKWAAVNNCNTTPTVTQLPQLADDGTEVTKDEYSSNSGNTVVGYTITNGGHIWPGGWQYLPKMIIGSGTKNLDACTVIWQFFKGHSLGGH